MLRYSMMYSVLLILINHHSYTFLKQLNRQHLQKATTRRTEGLYWVPGHARVRGNEIADKFRRDGSVQGFVGPEPFLGYLRGI